MPAMRNLPEDILILLPDVRSATRLIGAHPLKDCAVSSVPTIPIHACLVTDFFLGKDAFATGTYNHSDGSNNLLGVRHEGLLIGLGAG
jgi:hypothetical protein